MLSDEERKRRFLREANERIRLVNAKFAVTDGNVELFCECGASGCIELLQVPASAYDDARSDKQFFIARPGHERLGQEFVEADGRTYLVVRSHRKARRVPLDDARYPNRPPSEHGRPALTRQARRRG